MFKNRLPVLKEMLADDPNSSFLLFALAKEYEKVGQLQQAIDTFLNLIEKDAEYVGTYYHLAQLYEQTADTDAALKTYQQGIIIAKKVKDLHALSELQNAKMNMEV